LSAGRAKFSAGSTSGGGGIKTRKVGGLGKDRRNHARALENNATGDRGAPGQTREA